VVKTTGIATYVGGLIAGFTSIMYRKLPPFTEHVGDFALLGYIYGASWVGKGIEYLGERFDNKFLRLLGKYSPEIATVVLTALTFVTELCPIIGKPDKWDIPAVLAAGYGGYVFSRATIPKSDNSLNIFR
ncbi:MAG: hypothetical protein Q8R18_06765, partial [bacterium]|nr:hypothetical protein [bacterium]